MPHYVSVKEAVFPFTKFREFDPILGPEMRSTGEVMGISTSFGSAFAKAQLAADNALPLSGAVFITVNDSDKPTVTPIAHHFHEMGFDIYATPGTARYLRGRGIQAKEVFKVHEGRPHGIDLIVNGEVQLLINTPLGKHAQRDDYTLRQAAIANRVSYTTTLSAASRRARRHPVATLAATDRSLAAGVARGSPRLARGGWHPSDGPAKHTDLRSSDALGTRDHDRHGRVHPRIELRRRRGGGRRRHEDLALLSRDAGRGHW